MACHVLFLKNEEEFFGMLRNRNPELILKMCKSVLTAIRHKRKKIDIFDITFKDTSGMVFTTDEDQYITILKNCLADMELIEEYELCAEMKKVIDRASKQKRPRKQKEII
jgi:hypothetical protein